MHWITLPSRSSVVVGSASFRRTPPPVPGYHAFCSFLVCFLSSDPMHSYRPFRLPSVWVVGPLTLAASLRKSTQTKIHCGDRVSRREGEQRMSPPRIDWALPSYAYGASARAYGHTHLDACLPCPAPPSPPTIHLHTEPLPPAHPPKRPNTTPPLPSTSSLGSCSRMAAQNASTPTAGSRATSAGTATCASAPYRCRRCASSAG